MERRSYNQYCGLAKSLDIVGERWTLLIVRNLLLGSQRYSELLRGLPGITTNLLAKRLKEMEAHGLVEHIGGGADSAQSYRLTKLGLDLEPAVHALSRWGWHLMAKPGKGELRRFEWLMVALRRRYRGDANLRAELVVDDVPYRLVLAGKHSEIARGEVSAPDIRIRAASNAAAGLFLKPFSGGIPTGIKVEGEPAMLRTLVDAFAA